jgi:hypothetical protein
MLEEYDAFLTKYIEIKSQQFDNTEENKELTEMENKLNEYKEQIMKSCDDSCILKTILKLKKLGFI